MSSTFAFYRPRGVPHNYIVEITLDLLPTETADVSVGRTRPTGYNCGSCGHQHPTHTHSTTTVEKTRKAGRVETYEIGSRPQEPIIIGDSITIAVRDDNVVPVQHLVYTATANGFTCVAQPFSINGHTWQPHEIALQQIRLIDWGSQRPDPELHDASAVFEPETILSPTQQRSLESTSVVSPAQKRINLQAHLAKIEDYLTPYPYLSQAQIIHAMTQFSSANGMIDGSRLVKSLRRTNENMRRQSADAVPS